MDTITEYKLQGKAERDPDLARIEIGKELLRDTNIDGKTELSDKEIFAFAAVEAFTERIYTPRYVDVPYMSREEAFKKRHDLLLTLTAPELIKNPEAFNNYQKAIEPELRQLEIVLDPLAEVLQVDGEKIIRKTTPPIVYAKFAERIKKMRLSKDRKSRWEILNLVIVERTLNGLRDLLGRLAGEDKEPSGLVDRIRSYF